jgi:hypothetical protein
LGCSRKEVAQGFDTLSKMGTFYGKFYFIHTVRVRVIIAPTNLTQTTAVTRTAYL